MKIIWITLECPYPPNTGGRVGIWKRIEYMSRNNEIYLFSIIDDEEEMKYKIKINEFCKEVNMFSRRNLVESGLISFFKPFPAVSRWNPDMTTAILKIEKRIKSDYIVVDFPQMIEVLPNNDYILEKTILNQHNIEYLTMKSLAKGIKNPIKN